MPEGFIAGIAILAFLLIFGIVPGYAIGYRHGVKDTKPEEEERGVAWSDDQWD